MNDTVTIFGHAVNGAATATGVNDDEPSGGGSGGPPAVRDAFQARTVAHDRRIRATPYHGWHGHAVARGNPPHARVAAHL